jgi:hypothetical protein
LFRPISFGVGFVYAVLQQMPVSRCVYACEIHIDSEPWARGARQSVPLAFFLNYPFVLVVASLDLITADSEFPMTTASQSPRSHHGVHCTTCVERINLAPHASE